MDTWESAIYFREITQQCLYACEAFAGMERELAAVQALWRQLSIQDDEPDVFARMRLHADKQTHVAYVFYHLQNLLVASANVSKLLWPSMSMKRANRARADARATELRKTLYVPENAADSPLGARDLRNKFEHFDEMLDDALQNAGIIADSNINVVGQIQATEPVTYLRNFDSDKYVVTFMGLDPLPLRPLVDELQRLLGLARDLAQGGKGLWLW